VPEAQPASGTFLSDRDPKDPRPRASDPALAIGRLKRKLLYENTVTERRIASPEMFPEAEMLPHLICSRPMFIGGAKDEADQHGGA